MSPAPNARPNLQTMDDNELWIACQTRLWERQLEAAAFWIAAGGAFVAVVYCFVAFADRVGMIFAVLLTVLLSPVVVLVVGLSLGLVVADITRRRGKPYLEELQRRYGQGEFAGYVAQAMKEAAVLNVAPLHTLLLQLSAMPRGKMTFVRVELFADGEGTAQVLRGRRLSAGETGPTFGPQFIERHMVPLTDGESAELFAFLQENSPETWKPAELSFVIDGAPFRVARIDAQPLGKTEAYGNLAGLDDAQKTLPAPRLARMLLVIADRVL